MFRMTRTDLLKRAGAFTGVIYATMINSSQHQINNKILQLMRICWAQQVIRFWSIIYPETYTIYHEHIPVMLLRVKCVQQLSYLIFKFT